MPYYEFECVACGKFLVNREMASADYNDQAWCPLCGKTCRRVITPTWFQFRGGYLSTAD